MLRKTSWFGIALATCFLFARPTHAFLGLEKWFGKEGAAQGHRVKLKLESQKVQVFKIQQAKAQDLRLALDNYLDGLKSSGSLELNEKDNTIIATDDPEILSRLSILIKAMDQTYNNPDPKARQVLAFQQMRKAIHELRVETTGIAPAVAAVPGTPVVLERIAPGAPVGVATPMTTMAPVMRPYVADETDSASTLRMFEDRPPLQGFYLIGWYRDAQGTIVVLRNQGQRYFYRRGQVVYGRLASVNVIKGIAGMVQGDRLILRDENLDTLTLSLKPKEDRFGRSR